MCDKTKKKKKKYVKLKIEAADRNDTHFSVKQTSL